MQLSIWCQQKLVINLTGHAVISKVGAAGGSPKKSAVLLHFVYNFTSPTTTCTYSSGCNDVMHSKTIISVVWMRRRRQRQKRDGHGERALDTFCNFQSAISSEACGWDDEEEEVLQKSNQIKLLARPFIIVWSGERRLSNTIGNWLTGSAYISFQCPIQRWSNPISMIS